MQPRLTGEALPRQSRSLGKGKDSAAPAHPLGQGQSGEGLLSGQVSSTSTWLTLKQSGQ